MRVLTANIQGNPNIGLYGFCNNRYCLLGLDVPEKLAEKIGQTLKVPMHRTNLCGTSLLGVFCAGNDRMLLLPDIVFERELRKLEKWNIPHKIIDTKLTALGNNILCNNQGCLVNPAFSARVKKLIRQAMGVRLQPGTIATLPTVGALGVLNKHGCLLHKHATASDQRKVEALLGVKTETGTINKDSPYIKAGILVNDYGMVISDYSWGPEIGLADQTLLRGGTS